MGLRFMSSKTYFVAAAAIAPLVLSLSLTAQMTKSNSPAPSAAASTSPGKQANRPIPFHGMVSAVDQKNKTFTISGKEATRVFKVTDKTSIMKGAAIATMKAWAHGKESSESSAESAGDAEVLVSLRTLGQMTSSAILRCLPHNRQA